LEYKNMADNTATERGVKDPIVEGSLSWPLAIASLLLVLSTIWAAYDEFFGRRAWKRYQAAFVPVYRKHLQETLDQQRKKLGEIEAQEDYRQLKAAYVAVQEDVAPERKTLNEQLIRVTRQMEAIIKMLKEARSYTAAAIYKIEMASSPSDKEGLRAHLAEYHQGPFEVPISNGDGAETRQIYDYQQLLDAFDRVRNERSELRRQLGELVQREAAKKKAMNAYVTQHLDGPTPSTVEGQIVALDDFKCDITSRQIHVEEAGLVDRCEVCHLAIRSPVAVTAEDIRKASGGIPESMANAFASHPRIELAEGDLLKIHPPEKFGCAACHGGNGRALTSVEHAHGRYKHWLWPLYDRENTQVGCVQCHEDALYLEGAEMINRGRYLFLRLGCWGCHPREGYDTEALALKNTAQEERSIENQRHRLLRQLDAFYDSDHSDLDPDAIKQQLAQLDTDWDHVAFRKQSLLRARKNPAPRLKDVRAKLKAEWIPLWLRQPRDFRPTTRMPRFDLSEDQARAMSAFLWQAAEDKQVPHYERGDPVRGKELFETRGCQACHSVEGESTFAATLTRLAEKANYDYLVDWIKDPLEGAIMPDLRLADQEARDMATYLTDQEIDAEYQPAEYITDKSLFDEGRDLVKHFGCFGCHEVAGMENFGRVATDLTKEGSKPIERLDFGLFTHEAKLDGWYAHKGFFDRKLSDPQVFDKGKLKLDWHENLKMPDFELKGRPEDRRALVTFLLGSVDSQLPNFFYHNPSGPAKDIEAGWWVALKYNCVGCHQIVPGQTPRTLTLSQYQGEGREKAPPSLVGAGARIEADWLIKFLRDPALSETKLHRNGARMYLDVRMPTYKVSEEEIGKLVRFLNALSKQPTPYPFEKLEPLDEDELADARTLFQVGKCLSCHVTSDDPRTFTSETKAPSYIVGAERLKPRWMRHWLRDPDQIMPGTVMPTFFQEVDGRWRATVMTDDKVKVKDADQVELMVRYQKFFDEAEAEYWRQFEQAGE